MKYIVVDKLSKEQVQQLHCLYQEEWWTKGRTLEDVEKMLEHSDITVGLCEEKTNELIGFTRVLTDRVYKALVLDVIVKDDYRGHELGKVLMDLVVNHPHLLGVKHFELYCRPEMGKFYEKWGFTSDLGEMKFMRKARE